MVNKELQQQLRENGYKGKFELSELIEACMNLIEKEIKEEPEFTLHKFYPPSKNDIKELEKHHQEHWLNKEGLWHAEALSGIITWYCASGYTPEEAVCRLWLALNNKK